MNCAPDPSAFWALEFHNNSACMKGSLLRRAANEGGDLWC
jgi:hypothetical protein